MNWTYRLPKQDTRYNFPKTKVESLKSVLAIKWTKHWKPVHWCYNVCNFYKDKRWISEVDISHNNIHIYSEQNFQIVYGILNISSICHQSIFFTVNTLISTISIGPKLRYMYVSVLGDNLNTQKLHLAYLPLFSVLHAHYECTTMDIQPTCMVTTESWKPNKHS